MRAPALLSLLIVIASAMPAALEGQSCTVPGTHPTVQRAADDSSCTTVLLAAGTYLGDVRIARDLAVQGAGSATTVIAGLVQATGAGTDVTLASVRIDGTGASVAGCWPSLLVATGGAQVAAGPDVDVRNSGAPGTGCRLLTAGFETGDLSAWSAAQPPS